MAALPTQDPILMRFRDAVAEAYGDRLERIVLFGSRARGDHRPDSDYDVAVFVRDLGALWEEFGILADMETNVLLETGAIINSFPFPAGSDRKQTGFMHELRRDGLSL